MNTIVLTLLAMFAFAANSILCRIALGNELIDAATFTSIRLASGAITLAMILYLKNASYFRSMSIRTFNVKSSLALYMYAICFSIAYIEISTGTGALILFGTVQLTMILFGIVNGEKSSLLVWAGVTLACGGLVYLMLPGIDAPSPLSAILMTISGLAWAVYSLRGKNSADPVADTTWNFLGTLPFVAITSLAFVSSAAMTTNGILLAIGSGVIASGIGYVIWYAALPALSWTTAAIVQLSVPTIAAFGGVLFMSELITARLLLASVATLGGIAIVIYAKKPAIQKQ
jgi:drug/metabolite transporter (DMT)-like permease